MFTQFLSNVAYAYVRDMNLRFGQTCFNILSSMDEDLAESIRATELDPFHDDERVPEFLTRLRSEWDE